MVKVVYSNNRKLSEVSYDTLQAATLAMRNICTHKSVVEVSVNSVVVWELKGKESWEFLNTLLFPFSEEG